MVFPYTAFRCSSSSSMRLRSADLARRDSFLCSVLIVNGVDSPKAIPWILHSSENVNKVGSLPSGRVLLSQALQRYYAPLRLPRQPSTISVSLIRLGCGFCTRTVVGLPSCTVSLPPHAIPATPEDPEGGCSFESLRQRPSPSDHRVGISNCVTRLRLGSLALRPAALPIGNFNPGLLRRCFPVLERCTNNSFRGTSTR